jgi:hypothetical protein
MRDLSDTTKASASFKALDGAELSKRVDGIAATEARSALIVKRLI